MAYVISVSSLLVLFALFILARAFIRDIPEKIILTEEKDIDIMRFKAKMLGYTDIYILGKEDNPWQRK